MLVASCHSLALANETFANASDFPPAITKIDIRQLPAIDWQTGPTSPVWPKNDNAGSEFSIIIPDIPNDFRRFSDDLTTNTELLKRLQMPLLSKLPPQSALLPALANQWYNDVENRVLYLSLANATWSDDTLITTNDIACTIKFLSDPKHGLKRYMQGIRSHIKSVEVYSDTIIAFRYNDETSLDFITEMRPLAAHHYCTSNNTWPDDFIVNSEPVSGPYLPVSLDQDVLYLRRIKPWWGDQHEVLGNRFYVNKVRFYAAKTKAYQMFSEGRIDVLSISSQRNWNSDWLSHLVTDFPVERAIVTLNKGAIVTGLVTSSLVSENQKKAILAKIQLLIPEDAKSLIDQIEEDSSEKNHKASDTAFIAGSSQSTSQETSKESAQKTSLTPKIWVTHGDQVESLQEIGQTKITTPLTLLDNIAADPTAIALITIDSKKDTPAEALQSVIATLNKKMLENKAVDNNASIEEKEMAATNITWSITPLFQTNQHRYAFWPWVKRSDGFLPDEPDLLFDPLLSIAGGLFYIDRQEKVNYL
ncbi:MAG: ABC transporter substrate-binding protein, partial [Oleibacter sp.]|nr:ABC transporter substrate-binding protein [Thalassolituus sp.]